MKAHLGRCCSKNTMVNKHGSAVTVAYVQGNKPGKSFAQNQHVPTEGNASSHQGDRKSVETFRQKLKSLAERKSAPISVLAGVASHVEAIAGVGPKIFYT